MTSEPTWPRKKGWEADDDAQWTTYLKAHSTHKLQTLLKIMKSRMKEALQYAHAESKALATEAPEARHALGAWLQLGYQQIHDLNMELKAREVQFWKGIADSLKWIEKDTGPLCSIKI